MKHITQLKSDMTSKGHSVNHINPAIEALCVLLDEMEEFHNAEIKRLVRKLSRYEPRKTKAYKPKVEQANA
jgi:hypothetical protein